MDEKKSASNRRSDRVSGQQFEYLFNYMNTNIQLREGKLSPSFTKSDRKREWDRLAAKLNSLGGAIKDTDQWRKVSALQSIHKINL